MGKQATWAKRIVGHGEEAPDQLLANPRNFRIHPKAQQSALEGALNDLGRIQECVVNQRTGHLIDGHLRVTLAMRRGEPTVPVLYVDLSDAEEAEALVTLDPIAAMAATDAQKLDELLREVQSGEEGVQAMLSEMAAKAGLVPPTDPMAEWEGMPEFTGEDQTGIKCIVHFDTEDAKSEFEKLVGQKIPDNTKAIWYPAKPWADMKSMRYVNES